MSDTTKPKNTVGGSKDFARKARELIAMMTLEEKVSQLMNATPGIPRLGIPPYDYWNEALHGVARSGVATVFPEPIGLAATFNPSLIEKMADAIATEGRAKYAIARRNGNYARFTGLTYWSPNVNIFRDPRWGRGMETYGEDQFLSGVMRSSAVSRATILTILKPLPPPSILLSTPVRRPHAMRPTCTPRATICGRLTSRRSVCLSATVTSRPS